MTIRNLDALLEPASVALIGASDTPGSVGAIVAKNLLTGGFKGNVSFVNPRHQEVAGRPCFPSAAALPAPADLAIIATPPNTLPALISELGACGTRACVIITAGVSPEIRQKCLEAAKPTCLRLLGPNCLGLILPSLGFNGSFAHLMPQPGDLALISQSGALVTAMIDWAAGREIGFSHVVSLGDMADVDFGDLLDYLAADRSSRAILLYAEQITHAPKFMSAARRAARTKPVIVLKPGRHSTSAAAARSHTGALSGSDSVYNAAFKRAGLLRVNTLEEMFFAAEVLHFSPKASGRRLAILTNGGGAGVLAADCLADLGGDLAPLSPQTLASLSAVLPQSWSGGNPVDIIGDAPAARYEAALSILLNDPNTDAVLVMNCPTALAPSDLAAQAVIKAIEGQKALGLPLKPVLTNWLGARAADTSRQLFMQADLPGFSTPEEAVTGFMQLIRYEAGQKQLMETPPALPHTMNFDANAARTIINKTLEAGRTLLTEAEAKDVLRAYGIPVAETINAKTPDGAFAAATEILTGTKACVLKIVSPDISHKSDVGGVRLGLRTADEAREAAWSMLTEVKRNCPGARITGFAVEPMIDKREAYELIIGMSEDKTFGPVILFGAGGTSVEVTKDTAHALPPLNLKLAQEMIAETRVSRLLSGFRNRPPARTDDVAEILVRVSSLVANHPEIREIDINPVLTDHLGCIALDARIGLQEAHAPARTPFAVRPYPEKWCRKIIMPELGTLTMRPVLPEDEPLYQPFFSSMTAEDLRMRFFAPSKDRSHKFLARLTQIDYAREMAFVALASTGELLGVVRLVADPDYKRAEFAVLVRSDLKGRGLGWQMMQLLIEYAQAEGLSELTGDVLSQNATMLSMCRTLGFRIEPAPGDASIRRVTLDLAKRAGLAA